MFIQKHLATNDSSLGARKAPLVSLDLRSHSKYTKQLLVKGLQRSTTSS